MEVRGTDFLGKFCTYWLRQSKNQREPNPGIHGGNAGPGFILISAEFSAWDFPPCPLSPPCRGLQEFLEMDQEISDWVWSWDGILKAKTLYTDCIW